MKDWLSKYWIALCGLFVACLGLYLNLQNWKRQGTNLTALALNIGRHRLKARNSGWFGIDRKKRCIGIC
jgi:hypothetical protein